MANLKFLDYIQTAVAYAQEDRDVPEDNQLFRIEDVKRAINAGRRKMLREVGVGLYRKTQVMNATSGAIPVPEDFFNEAIIRYASPSNGGKLTLLKPVTMKYSDEMNPNWAGQSTGIPSSYVWTVSTTGLSITLKPQPQTPVADGLVWSYTAMLEDLVDDDDECPIMNMFPEFQMTTLQAGALRTLFLLEGGEKDDQVAKFGAIHDSDIENIRGHINRLFVSDSTITGR